MLIAKRLTLCLKWLLAFVLATIPIVSLAAWTYNTSSDRMDNAVFKYASVNSSEIVEMSFPYKNHRPELTVRTKNGGTLNILLEFSGQAQSGFDGGQIRVKFDSGPVRTWEFNRPADHGKSGLIFIGNANAFLTQMRKSKTVLIELPLYGQGRKTFGFDVTGLDVGMLGIKPAAAAKGAKK
jgi:hypothetical protein